MSSSVEPTSGSRPIKNAVIDPNQLPVMIDVSVPPPKSGDKAQRIRNFAYIDIVADQRSTYAKRFFCHAQELNAANRPALKQRLIKQIARNAPDSSPETHPGLADIFIKALEGNLKANISHIGHIIKKPDSDDILSVQLKPEVLKAENDIKSALSSVAKTNGGLFTIPCEHIPQILVTEGKTIENVLHESNGFVRMSQGYSLKYSGIDPSPNADIIFLCCSPCPSLRSSALKHAGSTKPGQRTKPSASGISDVLFGNDLAMRFAHELVHHYGLDEVVKKDPAIIEAITKDMAGIDNKYKILRPIYDRIHGRQVGLPEMLESMREAQLLPSAPGASIASPELYKAAVDRAFTFGASKIDISRGEYTQLVSTILNGKAIPEDKQAKLSRAFKEVLTQAAMVCNAMLINYNGSRDGFYTITNQDKADEIAPIICMSRTGFGIACTKEMLPDSHALLEQIYKSNNVFLDDQVKFNSQIAFNG